MRQVTTHARGLARKLLTREAGECPAMEQAVAAGERTWSLLRAHLVRLVGLEGYRALLSRSLVLAKPEVAWLDVVQIGSDASLEATSSGTADRDVGVVIRGHTAVLAQFIGLLELLVGTVLATRILADIWPDAVPGPATPDLEGRAEG